MKKTVLFLIICSFFIQASIKTVVFIDWKINQIQITELYCVNKDNPLMHCNGQCYLSKQLKQIEQDYQDSKAPFNPKNIKATEFVLFFEDISVTPVHDNASGITAHKGGVYENQYSHCFSTSFFHPPSCFFNNFFSA